MAVGVGTPNGDDARDKLEATLRQIVKEELLTILTDKSASAAARASAGRSLLDHFGDHEHASSGAGGKRGAELSITELDAEIELLSTKR